MLEGKIFSELLKFQSVPHTRHHMNAEDLEDNAQVTVLLQYDTFTVWYGVILSYLNLNSSWSQ